MNSAAMRERHLNEWLWFVIALGVVLRVQGLGWDQGLLLNPDERNIGTAAARLAFPDHLVPDFNAYNGLALYLPRLLAWLISPFTGTPGTDPAAIVLAGRALSAGYASLSLPVLAAIARRAFGLPIALFVVACAVFSPGLIQSAHFATTESGLVLCLTVLIWLCQTYLRGETGHLPFAAQAGLALGIGFGLKTTALVFAVCPLVAVLVVRRESKQIPRIIGMGALASAITLVLALITTPQLWAATHAYLDTMRFEGDVVRGTAEVYWTYQFEGAISGLFELSQLPWLLGPVVPALGLAAVVALAIALRRGDRRAIELLPVLAFAIVYSVTICSWYAKFVRYLAPLLPVLMLFAGYFCAQLADLRMRKGVMVATGVATALVGLMQAALYQNLDPRIAAWDWLLPQLTAGDRIWFKGAVFRSNVKDYIDFNLTATSFQAVNVPEARVFGAEGEAGYTSRYFFGSLAAGYVIGENITTGNSLSSIPAQKLTATIGGRLPEWDFVAGFRLNVASDQNRTPPPILGSIFGQPFIFQSFRQTSGYTTGDLFLSWVPSGKYISPLLRGFRLDAGIDNVWDKRYRSHLSIYPEAGINYKLALSYTVQFGGTN